MGNNNFGANTDDFAFSDEIIAGAMQKMKSALGDSDDKLKAFAANVLIGNTPAKKINENVGDEFKLCGFHYKDVKFKDKNDGTKERIGKYTVMFGYCNGQPCAYATSSDKVYEAVTKILYIYGDPSNWNAGINVRIRMNNTDNVTSYSLEII